MLRFARISIAVLPVLLMAGCGLLSAKKEPPPPVEFPVQSPYGEARTFAVAPAVNASGSHDFDPLVVSDILFGEMQQVPGLTMLPLNRTLAAMQRLGISRIDDPRAAQKIAEMLGADGLVVPIVTAYDPYNPPVVGMILQMYTPANAAVKRAAMPEGVFPNAASFAAEVPVEQRQPVSQATAVFNASNQSVLRELRSYSVGRTEYDSALREQKFLLDIDAYMRFVCHAMTRRLLDVESGRVSDR